MRYVDENGNYQIKIFACQLGIGLTANCTKRAENLRYKMEVFALKTFLNSFLK